MYVSNLRKQVTDKGKIITLTLVLLFDIGRQKTIRDSLLIYKEDKIACEKSYTQSFSCSCKNSDGLPCKYFTQGKHLRRNNKQKQAEDMRETTGCRKRK